jgi:hypothetical protein
VAISRVRFLLVLAFLFVVLGAGTAAVASAEHHSDARMCPTAVEYAV